MNHRFVLLAALCTLMLLVPLAGCQPSGREVAEVQTDAEVRRELAVVRAGPADADPLPRLRSDQPQDLPAGGLVMTDATGEASLIIDGCERIFIFQSSRLTKSPCPRSDRRAGNVTCAVQGTSVFNNTCGAEAIIETASADVSAPGTWLSMTYLPERQLSLVMVYEDEVEVWPVLDLESRTMGESRAIEAGFFWYTAPDDMLRPLRGLPPREPIPFDEMPPLIEELDLQPWMERIAARAEREGFPFPEGLLTGGPY